MVLDRNNKMKLKDFKKSAVYSIADCVVLYDKEGKEIEITSESRRRDIYNKEVVVHRTMVENGLAVLEVYLDM